MIVLTLLQDVSKAQKYVPKITEKSHFEISHYAMPPGSICITQKSGRISENWQENICQFC